MPVSAYLGLGARLYYSTDGSSYTELSDLIGMGSPDDPTVEKIDATPLNPNSNAREYLYGLIDYGKFTFQQYWTKARLTTLRGRLRTSTYWRVVFPDHATPTSASKLEFQGAPVKVRPGPLVNNQPISIDVEIDISGATTYTEAA